MDPKTDPILKDLVTLLCDLQHIVQSQQAWILAMQAYLSEQSFYDPSRFATRLEEFQTDPPGAVARRLATATASLQAWLRDFEGPPQ